MLISSLQISLQAPFSQHEVSQLAVSMGATNDHRSLSRSCVMLESLTHCPPVWWRGFHPMWVWQLPKTISMLNASIMDSCANCTTGLGKGSKLPKKESERSEIEPDTSKLPQSRLNPRTSGSRLWRRSMDTELPWGHHFLTGIMVVLVTGYIPSHLSDDPNFWEHLRQWRDGQGELIVGTFFCELEIDVTRHSNIMYVCIYIYKRIYVWCISYMLQ